MSNQAEQALQLSIQYRVATICNESTNIEEAARAVLGTIGEAYGWHAGEIWIIDPATNALSNPYTWFDKNAYSEIENANKQVLFHLNEGIPGHVWNMKAPYWSSDLQKDLFCTRTKLLSALHLKSALGFPILFQKNVLGVVLFFHDRIPRPDDSLYIMLTTVGQQLGQFLHRKQEETIQHFVREELYLKINELEEQILFLKQANESKMTFLANISHELRTPLNSVIGYTDLMYKEKVGPVSEIHKEYLGEIAINGRHLLHLIDDILDLTTIETGQMKCHSEPTDLSALTNDVHKTIQLAMAEKHIHYDQYIDPLLAGEIIIDPDKLKQILFNYLSNAIKFTAPEGNISVRLLPEPGENDFFRLEVSDTGIGISKKDIQNLFVMFGQLKINYSKPYHGTGLGLALTRHVAELLGGRVGVESEPGKGSTFFAILPLIFVKEPGSKDTSRRTI